MVTSVIHTNLWWTGTVFRYFCPALLYPKLGIYFVTKRILLPNSVETFEEERLRQPDFHAPSHPYDKAVECCCKFAVHFLNLD
jgi:hypothetical protein